jgi:hypothetical protein
MLNLKKTAVAVLALGSSAVFAGAMGPVCSAVNVTVPCESTAWDFAGQALYLQPSLSDTEGYYERSLVNNSTGVSQDFGRNAPWAWGFKLEGSYHFNTGNDLDLNWYHVNHSSTRNLAATRAIPLVDSATVTDTVSYGATSWTNDPHWDAVNLEFRQHVDFGEAKSIRFHGGIGYVRLTNSLTNVGSTTISSTDANHSAAYTYTRTANPTYNGFGPRLGADMAYDWGNGLGIYANGAAALFAGSSKFSTTRVDSLGNNLTLNGSRMAVVPELEAKLGATYTYAMAQGDLSLDAGWMWVNYFNAQQNRFDVLNSGNSSEGNFGLQGPFFGLKWVGNIA